MAGTIFGIPLSQRVDLNGQPSVGWLIYLYQANTSTPVNSYQDTALTVLNPWPIAADAYGMMRQFWLADGSYRARATNSDGSITYFDQPSILALGASTGAAPSGGVDANAIFQTGDVIWSDKSGSKPGWVRDNGRTLGSATSGAFERANSDCQPLFEFLWNTFSDAICPVVSGRGASSLADWTASKQITLPDHRGCGAIGADAMGSTSSGRFASVPIITGAIDTPGSIVGENGHVLTAAEIPAHTHSGTTGDDSPAHTHPYNPPVGSFEQAGGTPNFAGTPGTAQTGLPNVKHQHPFTTDNGTGGGAAHNAVARSIICTVYRKL
jgi:hypothetical protein